MTRQEAYVAMLEGNAVSHYVIKGMALKVDNNRNVVHAILNYDCSSMFHDLTDVELDDGWEIVIP